MVLDLLTRRGFKRLRSSPFIDPEAKVSEELWFKWLHEDFCGLLMGFDWEQFDGSDLNMIPEVELL